ncbi:MAG TPA: metallophosphoesterase [Methanotrichaceae archaeon]|nr:metallophosphoesterase [Methanotrichaceae archaeon]
MAEITPIIGTPLLLVEGDKRVLVAADIHLGLEHELWLGGASIPSQTGKLLKRLRSHISEIEPDRLVLLGDVKHNVPRTSWQERVEVPKFLKSLSELVEVDLVPGNHDSGIADLATEGTRIRSPSGYKLDDVGYFHGHTWPDSDLFKAGVLVAGHLHPSMRLVDTLGYSHSERAWSRGPLSAEVVAGQYGEIQTLPEIIVVPAFNWLCGGLPLNAIDEENEDRGPLLKMMDLDHTRAYMMDGTDLGKVGQALAAYRKKRPGKGYISRRSKR